MRDKIHRRFWRCAVVEEHGVEVKRGFPVITHINLTHQVERVAEHSVHRLTRLILPTHESTFIT
ncbi:hypothetical protein [Hydrogenophaga sp. RAC07]|uniref:hypothetical protein n=1 Tax=Hydrogenophaga sp. RAC07 TaxID=1842537 RepID=UPI0012EAAA77|nr:hypothetical protein [Hydrogenophaga sp. RAC07]